MIPAIDKILIETRRTKSVTTARKSMLNLVKLRADKIATFGPKVVILSARNTKIYKIRELRTAIFSTFYNISRPNFAILLSRERAC